MRSGPMSTFTATRTRAFRCCAKPAKEASSCNEGISEYSSWTATLPASARVPAYTRIGAVMPASRRATASCRLDIESASAPFSSTVSATGKTP